MTSIESRLQRLEDIEAIRALDAEYCRELDDGNWAALIELFTPDGEFIGLSHARGHAELLAFFGGLAAGGLTAFWHHVSNLEIELDGDTARVRSFLWQPCVQDGISHVAAGRYNDTLARTHGRWHYRSKRVSFDYFTPLSDGWDQGLFTLESARATTIGSPR